MGNMDKIYTFKFSDMKYPMVLSIFLSNVISFLYAQNVGIGTNAPVKLLSVNGSVLIDQGNTNFGSSDSASLRFGTSSLVAISSNRANNANVNFNGLDFWTNSNRRMVITSSGRVGIGTSAPAYLLDVDGSAKVGYLYTQGLYSTASIFTDFNLNAGGDLTVTDDATIMGNVGIGTTFSSSYMLLVDGNGLFKTNLGIDGNLRVNGKITNDGKGIVKSNSSTTLRAGFSSGTFGLALNPGQSTNVTFCITKFVGDNDNIRVMPAQFIPGPGNSNVGCLIFLPTTTTSSNADCGGGSSVNMRITNSCSSDANTGTNATLYLYSVATD
jgi:hypothetical protein